MTDAAAPTPTRGSYAKGIARRQEILDRAIEVFAQRGARRTSLRAIAAEVGVTHAALTHYFGSLEALLVAVYEESERRLDEETDAEHGARHPSPAELMRISAEKNAQIPGMVQLYSTLTATALEDNQPAVRDFITDRFVRVREELVERIAQLQAAGRIRDDIDPGLTAALVVGASDGLQTQWLLDGSVNLEAALMLLDRLLAPAAQPESPR